MLGTQTGLPQFQTIGHVQGGMAVDSHSFKMQRAAALGGSPTVLEPLDHPCFLSGSFILSPFLGPDPSGWPSIRPSPLYLKEA